MSCYDNRYVGLRPAGELSQDHIRALQAFGKDVVKPVFRAKCPPGYTHCAKAFDVNNPAAVANDKLWFVDEHGHVCMPQCGWGSQPDLRIKDRLAQMVRQGVIDASVTPAKIQQAATSMLCEPCGQGKMASRAACAVTSTIRDLQQTDAQVDANKLLGGMHSNQMQRSLSDASLAGGAKLSDQTKCDLQEIVKGLDATQRAKLIATCEKTIDEHAKKVTQKHKSVLECKLSRFEDSDIGDFAGFKDPGVVNLLLDNAKACAQYDGTGAPPAGCKPTSCFSTRANPVLDYVDLDDEGNVVSAHNLTRRAISYKPFKHAYHALVKLYNEFRRKSRKCVALTPAENAVFHCRIRQITTKWFHALVRVGAIRSANYQQSEFEYNQYAESLWKQFQQCASLCANGDPGCGDANVCVRSPICSSNSCVPAMLEGLRKEVKQMKKLKAFASTYQQQLNDAVTQHRRLSVV